ncbi:MAG TPA: DUF4129 domain-containing protein [Iamia sp.]|nr:DUF4129 domain-containing protein [Iamia sp.]
MPERRPLLAALVLGLALTVVGPVAVPVAAVVGGGPARQSEEDLQLPVDPDRDPEETRERAEEILRGDEYQAPDPGDRSVLDRVRDWIADRIPRIDGPGDGTGSRVFGYVVFGLVLVGGIAAVAYVLARTQGTRRPAVEPTDAEVDVTPLRTPTEWDAEAERCVRAGDHRGAVRARFRALTTALAERDLVADTPGRTAGELRDDVAERAPTLTPAFGAAADLFERVWFGGDPVGPEESAAAHDLARTALAAAPRRAARPEPDEEGT